MENNFYDDSLTEAVKTSFELMTENSLEAADKATDVTKDYEIVNKLNPKDVYDCVNEEIKNADIPVKEKVSLHYENQDKYIEGSERSAESMRKDRINKAICFLIVFLTIIVFLPVGVALLLIVLYHFRNTQDIDQNPNGFDQID